MTSPLAIVFGKHQTHGRPDLDRPDGCDHDRNTYHYRLVDGGDGTEGDSTRAWLGDPANGLAGIKLLQA